MFYNFFNLSKTSAFKNVEVETSVATISLPENQNILYSSITQDLGVKRKTLKVKTLMKKLQLSTNDI